MAFPPFLRFIHQLLYSATVWRIINGVMIRQCEVRPKSWTGESAKRMRLDRSLLSFTANQPIQRYAPWGIAPTVPNSSFKSSYAEISA
jgi:hypothetical protein